MIARDGAGNTLTSHMVSITRYQLCFKIKNMLYCACKSKMKVSLTKIVDFRLSGLHTE